MRRPLRFWSLVWMIVLLGPVSCRRDVPHFQVSTRPIINGTLDQSAEHQAVVCVKHSSGYLCSGTLIAPRVVVTAAHCTDGKSISGFTVIFGSDIHGSTQQRSVSDLWQHPGFVISHNPQDPLALNDISLLRLSNDAPGGITPIPYLPAAYALTNEDVGIALTFVGFGKDENGHVGRKLMLTGSLSMVCDGPGNCTWNGAVVGPHFIGFQESEGGPCSGDSGGPALVERYGQSYVAGLASWVDDDCQYFGASTKVDAYQTEIEAFIGNQHPEDCLNGIDDDADGVIDCADPECAAQAYCSGPVACESATALTCGQTVTGDSSGGAERYVTYGCSQDQQLGSEVAYQFSIPVGTEAHVTLKPSGGQDLNLFVLHAGQGSCDPSACMASSENKGGDKTEKVDLVIPEGGSYVVVDGVEGGGAYSLTVTCGPDQEDCQNGVDDDGDGKTDCADTDCATDTACVEGSEDCQNGVDDDGDGKTDCADSDCATDTACVQGSEDCQNGVDDDGDGKIDCEDSDCNGKADCGQVGLTIVGGCHVLPSGGRGRPIPISFPVLMTMAALWILLRRRR